MKRMRIMGLCLVFAFALTAMLAASAGAATPYKSSIAKTELWTPHAGHVECIEESKGEGESTSTFTGKTTVAFKGCKVVVPGVGSFACKSPTGASGEIITEPLDTVLGYLDAGKTEVGTDYVGEKTYTFKAVNPSTELEEEFTLPATAEFSCLGGALKVQVVGSLIGKTTGNINVSSTTSTTAFEGVPVTVFNCEKAGSAIEPPEPGKTYKDSKCTEPEVGGSFEVGSEKTFTQKITSFFGASPDTSFTHIVSAIPGKEANVILPSAGIATAMVTNNLHPKKPGSKKLVPTTSQIRTGGSAPEQGECVKAKKAKYSEPNCITLAPVKNGKAKGKYEWKPA
jgi:hypothetical protein